jgi:hypothetical protein
MNLYFYRRKNYQVVFLNTFVKLLMTSQENITRKLLILPRISSLMVWLPSYAYKLIYKFRKIASIELLCIIQKARNYM